MAKAKKTDEPKLLATGGGQATASGVSFQGFVSAEIAVRMVASRTLDARLGLGSAQPTAIRFETEVPVDDILVETDASGWVFLQGKNSLSNSSSETSELGKTCEEFVRLWDATSNGYGDKGWNRSLIAGKDAMVIAVGPGSSGPIKNDLAKALNALRSRSTATLTAGQTAVLASIRKLLSELLAARGASVAGVKTDDILNFVHVIEYDFGGAHRTASEAMLGHALENPSQVPAGFALLAQECTRLMASRGGIDRARLRAVLAGGGVGVKAPPDYQQDVQALRDHTKRVMNDLSDYERTTAKGSSVTIDRACTKAVVAAAASESFVLVGDPGTGKSAVINGAAQLLAACGSEIVVLAVDQLQQVESLEGLMATLGLQHPIEKVLQNWPGAGPGYLLLDALDTCRFGKTESLFRGLMQEVMRLSGGRWRVVASIRSFDLQLGREFRQLFTGLPPHKDYSDSNFAGVRHIRIPEWTDDEFAELLTKIPSLRTAIDKGGDKLRDLARVPFNTRLLADLISDGVEPEALEHLISQVQLLEMYWDKRIRELGNPAEQCLRTTVAAMVQRRRLQARKIDAGASTGDAIDQLLGRGVLVETDGGLEVAFRHHILFDYVASRVFVDLSDLAQTSTLLSSQKGLGLLIAPALSFALQHLWEHAGSGRTRFWDTIVHFAGDASSDPVTRSVAARLACDLPQVLGDMQGLIRRLTIGGARGEQARLAFRHIVGSLAVRFGDKQKVAAEPWTYLAGELAAYVSEYVWLLNQLVGMLLEHVPEARSLPELGKAARSVLSFALTSEAGHRLMPLAIGHLGKTFATGPAESRQLVKKMLTPERMAAHAHNEMHWLASEIDEIAAHDADLAVLIYRRVFEHTVLQDKTTRMGDSQILRLTSNARQDFKMAHWDLKEAFPKFLELNPLMAAEAAVAVAEGHVATEHRTMEADVLASVGGQDGLLTGDYSHLWAAEGRADNGDDAGLIVDALVEKLKFLPERDAVDVARRVVQINKLGWIWASLFMVAAERKGALADLLWPWAAQTPFVKCADTRKDAIDLIAAAYSARKLEEKSVFEQNMLAIEFPGSSDPAKAKLAIQTVVFSTIGIGSLVTAEAIGIAKEATKDPSGAENSRRPYGFNSPEWSELDLDDHQELRDEGANVDDADNAAFLGEVDGCERIVQSRDGDEPTTTSEKLGAVRKLADLIGALPPKVDERVLNYGQRMFAALCAGLMAKVLDGSSQSDKDEAAKLIEQLVSMLPRKAAADRDQWIGLRENTARAVLCVSRVSKEINAQFAPVIDELVKDESVDVRNAVADSLTFLWEIDRDRLWRLAELYASESNQRVVLTLVNVMGRVVHADPEKVAALAATLCGRSDLEDGEAADFIQEGLGSIVFCLWVSHSRPEARELIYAWLSDRGAKKGLLSKGAFTIRGGLVLGYDDPKDVDHPVRKRSQALASDIINAAARGVEAYLAFPEEQRNEDAQTAATLDAKLLDQMADQFFFAVGASDIRHGNEPAVLRSNNAKRQYLMDNRATFRRIGDSGTPDTIYNLLQLLEFLMPGEPAIVFELASHALLGAGEVHGYQFESLAVDQLVKMMGRFVADHRELFDDDDRLQRLVECLQVFVDAGWPSARRLLYRLPDILR